jgi:hypothetical protein
MNCNYTNLLILIVCFLVGVGCGYLFPCVQESFATCNVPNNKKMTYTRSSLPPIFKKCLSGFEKVNNKCYMKPMKGYTCDGKLCSWNIDPATNSLCVEN